MRRPLEPRRQQAAAELPVAEVRGQQHEPASLRVGGAQVLVALDAPDQAVGLRLATIGADEVGEADREVPEDVVHERRALGVAGAGAYAGDVGADPRALSRKPPRRARRERPRQRQPRRTRQRPGQHRGGAVDGRTVESVCVPAGRRRRGGRRAGLKRLRRHNSHE